MPSLDLRSFVARTAALVDSSPPASLGETRTWLVDPFLETLGWDVRADSCATDRIVDDVRLEYVPTVESVPALFVAVEPVTESLEEARANDLRRAMAWTGVDRALYTNGREYLFLAGTTEVEYRALELDELAANESAIADYSRTTVGQRLGRHTRTHVARQLAVERSALVESIADRLGEATVRDGVYTDEFEAATARFLDRLIVAFAGDETGPAVDADDVSVRFRESTIIDDGAPTVDRTDADADAARERDRSRVDARDGDSDRSTAGPRGDDGEHAARDDDEGPAKGRDDSENGTDDSKNGTDDSEGGEYVVRFFNERGSIGAIGHSTSTGALVEAADYLLERGLAGVDVPWSPDDGGTTVLNADPVRADGSPMTAPERLANGLVLETAGDVGDHAARVEALAARAGLRAMLTGDWE